MHFCVNLSYRIYIRPERFRKFGYFWRQLRVINCGHRAIRRRMAASVPACLPESRRKPIKHQKILREVPRGDDYLCGLEALI